jgi:cytochrome o ubiquinol oxidase subunit 2
MIKRKRRLFTPLRIAGGAVLLSVMVGLGTWLLLDGKNIAVLNPQGVVATQQKDLIIFTLLLSLVVVIPVFVMLGVFAWKYREGNTGAKYTPEVDGNRWMEALWWGIPVLIIAILGYVTVKSTYELDPYKPLASDIKPLKVQVVALQWKWLFLYPEQHVASINVFQQARQ